LTDVDWFSLHHVTINTSAQLTVVKFEGFLVQCYVFSRARVKWALGMARTYVANGKKTFRFI